MMTRDEMKKRFDTLLSVQNRSLANMVEKEKHEKDLWKLQSNLCRKIDALQPLWTSVTNLENKNQENKEMLQTEIDNLN